MRRVAIIPARGGSQRVPWKNIRLLCGRPIICYSIETAKKSGAFDEIYVSTDDEEIAHVARAEGATVVYREPDNGDKGTQDVAGDVLQKMPEVDVACVIYATSPLLLPSDLVNSMVLLNLPGRQFVMSVGEPLQDAGCFYWGWANAFRDRLPLIAPHTAMYPLPPERVCDINTLEDFSRATYLFQALRRA